MKFDKESLWRWAIIAFNPVVVAAALGLALAGCDHSGDVDPSKPATCSQGMRYVQDNTTGLCFAREQVHSIHSTPGFTWVPCSALVLSKIKKCR